MQNVHFDIYASPLPIPFSFAFHTWIVGYGNDWTARYEVWQRQGLSETSWGHVYQNLFPVHEGIRIFYLGKRKYSVRLLFSFEFVIYEHPEKMMLDLISDYPFKQRYLPYPGPNSNTFVQWFIDRLPIETKFILPWRAFGKSF